MKIQIFSGDAAKEPAEYRQCQINFQRRHDQAIMDKEEGF